MTETTFLEAAYKVLSEVNKPITAQNIIDEVLSRGLWVRRRADRPETAYNSLYGTLIKAVQHGDDRIGRIGNTNEFYALNRYQLNRKTQKNFIMTWNPAHWQWTDLDDNIKQLQLKGSVERKWSCGNRKNLPIGSRVFLFKQGAGQKGIIGAGITLSEPKDEPHFDPKLARQGKVAKRVNINWSLLSSEPIIPLDRLKLSPFSEMSWVFQSSGVEIKSDIANALITELNGKKQIKSTGPVSLDQVESSDDVRDNLNYSKADALKDLFISEELFDSILERIKVKKNIIIQGPPGVGKTFLANRMAYCLNGSKDSNKYTMVQFHQSYSYEDFIQGFRPNSEGKFDLRNGVFFEFCRVAHNDPSHQYTFIIDEINRGNLGKVFGELFMLIEADKRSPEYSIPLTYAESANDKFYIPNNLHLIGTMNTADRSLAMVDYALRRRFSFITLPPQFDSPKFKDSLHSRGVDQGLIDKIISNIQRLNDKIRQDSKNLGKRYCIGHSYFCPPENGNYGKEWYSSIVETEIRPLLEEYWFDEEQKVESIISNLLA